MVLGTVKNTSNLFRDQDNSITIKGLLARTALLEGDSGGYIVAISIPIGTKEVAEEILKGIQKEGDLK